MSEMQVNFNTKCSRRNMGQTVIFHSDLPAEIRHFPYDRRNAGRLTKAVWQQAQNTGLEPPFGLDRMDDRIVIRELKPAGEKRAEVAA
jgi:hypothetical protein